MIGFHWHIVTLVVLLAQFSEGFSQSPGRIRISPASQAGDTIGLPHHETVDSLRQSAVLIYDSLQWAKDSVTSIAETTTQRINDKIDSLTSLGLGTGEFVKRPDTINIPSGNIGDLAGSLAPTLSGQAPIQQQGAGVIPADVDGVAAMVETNATAAVEATGISKSLNEISALNPVPGTPADPEAMKEELVEDGKKMAVNHFAGKEEQLQQAIDKLSVYKKKYHSFESVANLPKKAPNPMREKTFVERLLPGIALRVGRNEYWLLDVNVYAGYLFNGRVTAGVGWNQRIAYSDRWTGFSSASAIYGPRAYGEYNIGKGFSPRLELEYMNAYVPAAFASRPDNPDGREWVFGVMTGMKKEYTITRSLKGTVFLMYNVYDPDHRSPYRNRLNGRFGVEWSVRHN